MSFRREKYIPRGGPDGGDGGRGGNLIIKVQSNLKTLTHLRPNGKYFARDGQPGAGRQKSGSDGESVIIAVPPGSRILDAQSSELMLDLVNDGDEIVLLKGGRGGQGNMHFATSRVQAPRYAQPGLPGHSIELKIEMNLIADIGFVGFPNAGKSSLLKVLTAADPKIAAYPFTTKIPNLGVMYIHNQELVLADIPGIIEGASQGLGLGFRFLKHIHRTAGLAFLVDMSEEIDHEHVFKTLLSELSQYAPELVSRPRLIIATKLDMPEAADAFKAFTANHPDELIYGISAHTNLGLGELKKAFWDLAHPGKTPD